MESATCLADAPHLPPAIPNSEPIADVAAPQASPEFLAAVRTRLNLLVQIDALAPQRAAFAGRPDLPADVAAELQRQSAELKTTSPLDQSLSTFHQLHRRLNSLRTPAGRVTGGGGPSALVEVLQLGAAQARLLAQRAALTDHIITQAARLAHGEPLYGLLTAAGASHRPSSAGRSTA